MLQFGFSGRLKLLLNGLRPEAISDRILRPQSHAGVVSQFGSGWLLGASDVAAGCVLVCEFDCAFVAHGFAALTDMTITYLVDGYYNGADELGVAWDDPAIEADWGVTDPVLSDRDRKNPRRADLGAQWQPHYSLRP